MTNKRPEDAERALPARRRVLGLAGILAASATLAACKPEESELNQQNREGTGKGYIAGDGSVNEYAPGERGEPVDFTATTFDGQDVSTSTWPARVTVLNFWYAACAPCRSEAPTLSKLSERFKGKDVQFLGVNVRDEKAAADSFDRTFKIGYPSIKDLDGGVLLSLTQYVPPQAVPTTLVLDKERRVAARILGAADESTLRTLIESAAGTSK